MLSAVAVWFVPVKRFSLYHTSQARWRTEAPGRLYSAFAFRDALVCWAGIICLLGLAVNPRAIASLLLPANMAISPPEGSFSFAYRLFGVKDGIWSLFTYVLCFIWELCLSKIKIQFKLPISLPHFWGKTSISALGSTQVCG